MFRVLQIVTVLLTAIAMAAGWAHLLALPNKMAFSRAEYLVAQQSYRGWSLLGGVVIGALVCVLALTVLERGAGRPSGSP